jgi:hypothetical protein
MKFNGADYDHARDQKRLSVQLMRVWNVMSDGAWRTLAEISQLTGDPPASISAQLRHLRKSRFGCHEVRKVHLRNGLYVYSLRPNPAGVKPYHNVNTTKSEIEKSSTYS